MMNQWIKIIMMAGCVLGYAVSSLLVFPLYPVSIQRYRWINSRLISFYSSCVLRIIGCRVTLSGKLDPLLSNMMIVSNHLSYLDILILSSIFPACYVTSQEVKETIGLGHLTRLAGCLFVERRSRNNLGRETDDIRQALGAGLNVVIFPEGTSTNGDSVLRFRQPLFQAAIDAKKPVLPVTLNYVSMNREPVTRLNRDRLFWYGDMTFLDHFLGLGQVGSIDVRLRISEALPGTIPQACPDLSVKAHDRVVQGFVPVS